MIGSNDGGATPQGRDHRYARRHARSRVARFRARPIGGSIPAGSVEPGEAIAVAAKRELQEEAGLAVDGIELLTSFRNDSKPDERYCVQYVPLLDAPSDDASVVINHVYRLPPRLYGKHARWADVARPEQECKGAGIVSVACEVGVEVDEHFV